MSILQCMCFLDRAPCNHLKIDLTYFYALVMTTFCLTCGETLSHELKFHCSSLNYFQLLNILMLGIK